MTNSERRYNALERKMQILARLNDRGQVSVRDLAEEFGVTVRTIQNDLKDLRDLMRYPVEAIGKSGHWRFKPGFKLTSSSLSAQEKVILLLALDKLDKSEKLETLIEGLKEKLMPRYERLENERPLQIKTSGLEDYDPQKGVQWRLEQAIEERQVMRIGAHDGHESIVEPYKILNFDDVDDMWYLFGKNRETQKLDLWLLDDIEKVEHAGESFYVSEASVVRWIEERVHSPQFEDGERFDVVVRIDPKIAHVFGVKKLSTQETVEIEPDGTLWLRFEVSHIEDVDNLVKSWLPDIEVIEPVWYREKLAKELKEYLERLGF